MTELNKKDEVAPSGCHTILVLDSGIGGLSICQNLLAQRSDLKICYFADDEAFPYGVLEESALQQRLSDIVSELLKDIQPSLIVIACNTASTSVLPTLRAKFNLPVVGVVPAIKPAAEQSQTKSFVLLATPATVKRKYIDDLIREYASGCDVLRIGSKELVHLAEQKLVGEPIEQGALLEIVEPILSFNKAAPSLNRPLIDSVVLGCTHFPFLAEELTTALPGISLIDTGSAIANRVDSLLPKIKLADCGSEHDVYYSSKLPDRDVLEVALNALGFNLGRLELRCINGRD